ncbi:MAG: RsmE family RNA methyltransferase [Acidimicrobiales bacterium]
MFAELVTDPGLRARPLVYVDDLDRPRLTDADHHHLGRALRLTPGRAITLSDGRGAWRSARFGSGPEPDLVLDDGTIGPILHQPAPARSLTVAFAPVKGERPETVTQRLVEVGVDRIIPVITERTVVRWDDQRAGKQHDRIRVAAREAGMQSRRVRLPVVDPPAPLAAVLDANPGAVLAEPSGRPLNPADRMIVIGPEGGFSPAELARSGQVVLPGRILRAGTAAVVAGAMLVALRGGLVTPGEGDATCRG